MAKFPVDAPRAKVIKAFEKVTVQPVILNGVNAERLAKYSDCQSGVRDAKRSSLS